MTDNAAQGKGPDELRRQVRQTRKELGSTVEELAGKVDVKGRAKARAADLRDRAGAMTVQLRSTAAQAGHTAHDSAARAGHTVQDRATRAGHAVEHNVPSPVRTAVQAGLRHPRQVLVAGAAVGAAVVTQAVRRRHSGRH